jgi:hypothetical protein
MLSDYHEGGVYDHFDPCNLEVIEKLEETAMVDDKGCETLISAAEIRIWEDGPQCYGVLMNETVWWGCE